MNLSVSVRIAVRELRAGFRNGLRGFRIFIACLALGVAAIAAVGSVRSAIEAGLSENGARLLGGQAELEFTYRFANDREQAWLAENTSAVSEIADFRSMVVVDRPSGAERGLTQVKAVDAAYPLVGSVELDPMISLELALGGADGTPGAVMDRLLMDRLALNVGDTFRLGTQTFVLMAELISEPDNVGAFGLGPRTMVALDGLDGSGLLAPGTLFSTKYRMMFDPNADLSALEAQVDDDFAQSGARWQDARNGAPGVSEFVDRLGGFLVLVGLSGLAVGGVGVASAVRAFLARKTNVIATLKTLGAGRSTIFQIYFLQVGVLSVIAIGLGLMIGAVIPIALAPILQANLPVPAAVSVYPAPLAEAAVYGVLAAFLFTLWPLAKADNIRAASLFRDALASGPMLPRPIYLVALLASLSALVGSAAIFSGSPTLTLWVAGGIGFALVLLVLAAILTRQIAKIVAPSKMLQGRIPMRLALASIAGPREEATSVVLSLGLGLSVLAAVGQIDGNLRNSIQGNLPDIAPSYFFVDIQSDQLPGFSARLDDDPTVQRVETAPMLRGIITHINDQPARDVAGDHWVLEGDRGVTYAATPPDGTTITDGMWWAADYSGPPQISFAAEEAEEMGLTLGDSLTVNILGRDITGTITSLREVDFSTAGIGFILSMNPSALAGAPHSHIATVYADEASEAAILRDLAAAYPNITAIRVRDAIDRVASVLGSLATATSYGALATLITGFLVLMGAAASGIAARTYEAAILKTLGASRGALLRSFALRSGLLGLAAGSVALAAGCVGGWAVCTFVLETEFSVIWPNAIAIISGGVLATLFANLVFAARPLAARPAQVLRAKE